MSNEDPPVLSGDELAALWAETVRDAAMLSALTDAHEQKLRRYEHELARAAASNVRRFPLRPANGEPPAERGPDEHGNGDPDPSSL